MLSDCIYFHFLSRTRQRDGCQPFLQGRRDMGGPEEEVS